MVTTKEWSFSYSKLKNYETCPKRHYEIDLAKSYVEVKEPGGPLDWGDQVHAAMAKALRGQVPVDADGIAVGGPGYLPPVMEDYQHWVDKVKRGPGTLLIEQKYAITKDFKATQYFANNVWLRMIGDVVRIDGPVALALDWKTGRVPDVDDSVQLMLMAQAIFSFYPLVQHVRSEYIWLKENCSSPEVFTRQSVALQWVALLDRVAELKAAHDAQNYPPKPNKNCKKWCVVISCPFHGKGY